MSAGLPVVATAVGGVPDVVTDDVEGLAGPSRPPRRSWPTPWCGWPPTSPCGPGSAAASRARSAQFDVRDAARAIEAVYAELLSTPAGVGERADGPVRGRRRRRVPARPARHPHRHGARRPTRGACPGHAARRPRRAPPPPPRACSPAPTRWSSTSPWTTRAGTGPRWASTPAWCGACAPRCGALDPTVVVAHGGDPLKYLVPAIVGTRPAPRLLRHGHLRARRRAPARVALWRALVRPGRRGGGRGRRGARAVPADSSACPATRSVLAPNGRDPVRIPSPGERRDDGDAGRRCSSSWGRSRRASAPTASSRWWRSCAPRAWRCAPSVCGDGPLAPASSRHRPRTPGSSCSGSRSDVAERAARRRRVRLPQPAHGRGHARRAHRGRAERPAGGGDGRARGARPDREDGVRGFVVDDDDERAMVDATARLLVRDRALRRPHGEAARAAVCGALQPRRRGGVLAVVPRPPGRRGASGSRRGRSGRGTRHAPGA